MEHVHLTQFHSRNHDKLMRLDFNQVKIAGEGEISAGENEFLVAESEIFAARKYHISKNVA